MNGQSGALRCKILNQYGSVSFMRQMQGVSPWKWIVIISLGNVNNGVVKHGVRYSLENALRLRHPQRHMRPLPQNLRIEFSAYVRSARQAQGLTIQEMAAQMGIHRARLSQLERAVHNITFATMDALVAHLVYSAGPMRPYSQTIAERVSQARAGRFSQERLSELAGLSVNFVNSLERGQANSSIDQIEALAVALGIDGLDLIAV